MMTVSWVDSSTPASQRLRAAIWAAASSGFSHSACAVGKVQAPPQDTIQRWQPQTQGQAWRPPLRPRRRRCTSASLTTRPWSAPGRWRCPNTSQTRCGTRRSGQRLPAAHGAACLPRTLPMLPPAHGAPLMGLQSRRHGRCDHAPPDLDPPTPRSAGAWSHSRCSRSCTGAAARPSSTPATAPRASRWRSSSTRSAASAPSTGAGRRALLLCAAVPRTSQGRGGRPGAAGGSGQRLAAPRGRAHQLPLLSGSRLLGAAAGLPGDCGGRCTPFHHTPLPPLPALWVEARPPARWLQAPGGAGGAASRGPGP
jgi:hypothetical protein